MGYLTAEEAALVLKLNDQGLSPVEIVAEISKTNPTSYQSIISRIKKSGRTPNLQTPPRPTDEQASKIRELALAGTPKKKIAESLGVTLAQVRWATKDIQVSKDRHLHNIKQAQAIRAHQAVKDRYGVDDWDSLMHQEAAKRGGRFVGHVTRNRDKADFVCHKGHTLSVRVSNLLANGTWCRSCANATDKTTEQFKAQVLEQYGYILLDKEYRGVHKPHRFKCPQGHEFRSRPEGFRDHGCASCAGNEKLTIDGLRKMGSREGWTLLSTEYLGYDQNHLWLCPARKHKVLKRPANIKWSGCRRCEGGRRASRQQLEVQSAIQEMLPGVEVVGSQTGLLANNRFELDIWIPSLRIGIEYCGIAMHGHSMYTWKYRHSTPDVQKEAKAKSRNRHLKKLEECEAAGIRLITIFSDEWFLRKQQVLNYLRAILGARQKSIGARKCVVEKVPVTTVTDFMDKHHIQGAEGAVAYRLAHNGETVAVATFDPSNPGRKGKPQAGFWELTRYCVGETGVAGGLSKILKAFIKTENPHTIVSFSDRRWSQGGMYAAAGFSLTTRSKPSYWYFKRGTDVPRYHKFGFRKARLAKMMAQKGLEIPVGATEFEMARMLKFDWIWDCGLDRWEMKI